MDVAKVHVAMNSLLECSKCLQVYQDPRRLPCGNNLCLDCFQNTINQLCPLSKRELFPPSYNLQSLPENDVVESFISSLPSVYKCGLNGGDSHGSEEFLFIDCWDPFCGKCAQGHTQFSRGTTTNHVIKQIFDVDEPFVKRHNRQEGLICVKHKDQAIILYCRNCEELSCNSCCELSHSEHNCINAEEADQNIKTNLKEFVEVVQGKVQEEEAKLKVLQLTEIILNIDREKLEGSINSSMNMTKQKVQEKFDELINKVDECHKNAIQLINNKVNEEKAKLTQIITDTKTKLHSLIEYLSSLQNRLSLLPSTTERLKPVKNKNNEENLQLLAEHPIRQLTDTSQWISKFNYWLLSYMKSMLTFNDIPLLKDDDFMVMSENRFALARGWVSGAFNSYMCI